MALGTNALPALPQLVLLLGDTNCSHHAAYALGQLGDESLPYLINGTHNQNRVIRRSCVVALGNYSCTNREVALTLFTALKDTDNQIRYYAIQSISRSTSVGALKDWGPASSKPSNELIKDIIWAIRGYNTADSKAALYWLSQGDDYEIKAEAVRALKD
jgi:hypothetical protein